MGLGIFVRAPLERKQLSRRHQTLKFFKPVEDDVCQIIFWRRLVGAIVFKSNTQPPP